MEPEQDAPVTGLVIMPVTEEEEARARIIERNNALGIDTKLEELM